MDHFRLLELIASEVFSSHAMQRHDRTAQFLSAVAVLSQALARRQSARSRIERSRDLLARTTDVNRANALQSELDRAQFEQDLAELELRAVAVPIHLLAGAHMEKSQVCDALRSLADEVNADAFPGAFPREEALDRLFFTPRDRPA